MGKKYIVEIGRLERLYKASVNGNGKPDMTWLSPEVDLTPYTEPDLEQVRKESYDKGYDDAAEEKYNDGLADAWEAARKIYDISQEDRLEIFPEASTFVVADICDRYSASECIEKIRQYEQEKLFCVGDEFETESGKRFVITKMDGKEVDRYIDGDGKTYCMIVKYQVMRKTGRHFPEIAEVLKKMRGEQDG